MSTRTITTVETQRWDKKTKRWVPESRTVETVETLPQPIKATWVGSLTSPLNPSPHVLINRAMDRAVIGGTRGGGAAVG